jgi:superfamily I DNA/RNA helicase
MKVSEGLRFPVVAMPSAGHMPAKGEDQQEAAQVFYVAATRATQRLVIGMGGVRLERRKGAFEQSKMHRIKADNDRIDNKNPTSSLVQ